MTPRELHRRVFEFRFAAAVFAGIDLGLFTLMSAGPSAVAALATRAGCDARALQVWLDALAAFGIVRRAVGPESGHGEPLWEIEPRLKPCFDPESPAHLGHLFQHDLWHWTRWGGLAECLRTGLQDPSWAKDRHLSDPDVLRRFLPNYVRAMRESGHPATLEIARRVAKPMPAHVVDFGGGDGEQLVTVCQLLPEARATLVEHRFALDEADRSLRERAESERIARVELDFEYGDLCRALGAPFDAAILSRVLMGLSPERAQRVIQRIVAVLEPGGHLWIHDFALDSRVGAMLGIDMLLNTGGQVHSGECVRAWMEEAGLEAIDESPLLTHTRLFVGRKREG